MISALQRLRVLSRFSKPLIALGIIVLGFLIFQLLVATEEKIEPQPRREVVNQVEVTSVRLSDARPIYYAYGTVEATRSAELRFAIGGEIEMITSSFSNGALVRKGEELARLDVELLTIARDEISEQLRAERLNVEALATQHALRQKQYERIKEMREAAIASESSLDQETLILVQAENALSQARGREKQLELSLARATRNLREATLIAPFNGALSRVDVGEGKVVSVSTSLGVITDLSKLEVSFVVPSEVYASGVSLVGERVEIVWKAGGRDVHTASATIIHREASVLAAEGGGRLYATLVNLNPQEPAIPPGAFVEVKVPSLLLKNVAIIPDTALFDNDTIYVIEGGRAVARKVEVLARSEGNLYLRGDVATGDNVIITRIPRLGEGVRVQAVSG